METFETDNTNFGNSANVFEENKNVSICYWFTREEHGFFSLDFNDFILRRLYLVQFPQRNIRILNFKIIRFYILRNIIHLDAFPLMIILCFMEKMFSRSKTLFDNTKTTENKRMPMLSMHITGFRGILSQSQGLSVSQNNTNTTYLGQWPT